MKKEVKVGVIGGSGLEKLVEGRELNVITPYGNVRLILGKLGECPIAFIARHGLKHEIPPHRVNYRGNIWALKKVGVKYIIASNAVGGIREGLKPGDLIVPHDFIDFTKKRPLTFYEGPKVKHVDMTLPYCPKLRKILIESAEKHFKRVWREGIYVCTEGPRFETPAEIKMFRLLGADVVGMTTVPETILAKEMSICYATLCVITNYAAGMQDKISAEEVSEIMEKRIPIIAEIFKDCAARLLIEE
ncbi:MAG: S-methyl-5'-thioadenosine phosphorylase [Candidatus Verstraetearchaeota archaeon]|nr:S-methyl-5'-thioadenosine phosphorylase [Candidatus Verstraetearchaeota archaeon]RLE56487.1 MAG: S-methyl-5'-thioadenosine phosphorylase [Candidatus Verstraetearchaeota archaeon]